MQGRAWMDIFGRIPLLQQDGLGIVTVSGLEINLQSVMRMEEDYLVARGRVMGSTDSNLTFFVPYDQINTLIFQRVLKEEEIQGWYDDKPKPAAKPKAAEAPKVAAAVEPQPAPEPAPIPMPEPAPAAMSTPGKTAILERLRRRTSEPNPPRPGEAGAPKSPGM